MYGVLQTSQALALPYVLASAGTMIAGIISVICAWRQRRLASVSYIKMPPPVGGRSAWKYTPHESKRGFLMSHTRQNRKSQIKKQKAKAERPVARVGGRRHVNTPQVSNVGCWLTATSCFLLCSALLYLMTHQTHTHKMRYCYHYLPNRPR